MFLDIAGLTWSGLALLLLVSLLFGLYFHIQLQKEARAHKETQKVLEATRALLRLVAAATVPGSATMVDHYGAFLELVPSGAPKDIGSDYPCREVTRIGYKCKARELLGDLYTLRQYVLSGTDCHMEVVALKRKHGVDGVVVNLAELAERILDKLRKSIETGCFDYVDIGTSDREVGEIIATMVRRSSTDLIQELKAHGDHVTCLQETLQGTVKRLSKKLGANYLPLLETAMGQSPLEPGKEAKVQAQA